MSAIKNSFTKKDRLDYVTEEYEQEIGYWTHKLEIATKNFRFRIPIFIKGSRNLTLYTMMFYVNLGCD